MQTAVCFLVVCCLGMALAEGEVPECPGLTEEQLTQLKSLTVTEDIHDKVGEDSRYDGQACMRGTRDRSSG